MHGAGADIWAIVLAAGVFVLGYVLVRLFGDGEREDEFGSGSGPP